MAYWHIGVHFQVICLLWVVFHCKFYGIIILHEWYNCVLDNVVLSILHGSTVVTTIIYLHKWKKMKWLLWTYLHSLYLLYIFLQLEYQYLIVMLLITILTSKVFPRWEDQEWAVLIVLQFNWNGVYMCLLRNHVISYSWLSFAQWMDQGGECKMITIRAH